MTTTSPSRHRNARRRSRTPRWVAALLAMLVLLAACGNDTATDASDETDDAADAAQADDDPDEGDPDDSDPDEGEADDADAGEGDASAGDQVTLRLTYVNDPISTELIEAFEAEHPDIAIDATLVPFADYVRTIRLDMAADTAPDIAQYNGGAMRTLIPAGHLLELNEYEDSLDWTDKFPQSSLDVLRTDDEALRFGVDTLYAVPGALSVTGVYYNKEVADSIGLDIPVATVDDFEAAMAAAQDEGVTPITVGGLDTNHIHLWGAILNVSGDPELYRDWAYGAEGATIMTDPARDASQRIIDWVDAGFIPGSANGTAAADAAAEFAAGDTLFHLTGNWSAVTFDEDMGDNVGFFLFPTLDGSPPDVANGASVAWSVSAHTEHPEEAAAFLDFMATPEAAAAQVNTGFMPINTAEAPEADGVTGEIVEAFDAVTANDGIMPFPDFPAPALLDVLTAGIQGLIAGQMTPDDYLQSVQDSWEGHLEG